MDDTLNKHFTKVSKALGGLVKRSSYKTEAQEITRDTVTSLDLFELGLLDEEQKKILGANLNKFQKGIFKEDEEIVNSINEIEKQLEAKEKEDENKI